MPSLLNKTHRLMRRAARALSLTIALLLVMSGCRITPWSARVPMTTDIEVTSPYRCEVTPDWEWVIVDVYAEVGESTSRSMPSWWWLTPTAPFVVLTYPEERCTFIRFWGFEGQQPKIAVTQDWELVKVVVESLTSTNDEESK